ncbi:MAG: V-type ATPase subunit [Spirochaetia bacterium]
MNRVGRYAFIHAKLRARLSKMLSSEKEKALSEAASLNEGLHLLKGTEYEEIARIYESTGDLKMCELELRKKEITTLQEIRKNLKEELADFIDALLLYYETDKVKNLFRLWFDRKVRGRDIRFYTGYLIHDRILYSIPADGIINADSPAETVSLLEGTPFREPGEQKLSTSVRGGSLFLFETELDRIYYRELFTAIDRLPKKDRGIALKLYSAEVDLENINRIIRFSNFYGYTYQETRPYLLPYGEGTVYRNSAAGSGETDSREKEQELYSSVLEDYGIALDSADNAAWSRDNRLELLNGMMEQVLDREVQKILYGYPFTIGIILAYIIRKKKEINRVMGILNTLNYKTS